VIVFVRHGETPPNRSGLLLGRFDPSLTDAGRLQAEQLAIRVRDLTPDTVISSPLVRARETATPIAVAIGCAVEIDNRLVEIDYGEWDGRPFAELPPDVVARWQREPDFAPPGGESLGAVGTRVAGLCDELLTDDRVVVAVSHVSPIKAAVCWALGVGDELAWRMRLDVASITRIARGPAGPVLLGFNEAV
jgi:broad specificity phosphatase PhoE